jgi:hypothetical protein
MRWSWNTFSQPLLLYGSSRVYVTTDGQSANLSWNKTPIWGLRPDFYYRQTVACLLMWGALSDERTDLSFTISAGPCQRSLSRDRVLWDSRPYLRSNGSSQVKVTLQLTVSQSVSLGVEPHLGLMSRYLLPWQLRSCFCGALSLTRRPVWLLYMLLALGSAVILGSESLGTRDHILLSQI